MCLRSGACAIGLLSLGSLIACPPTHAATVSVVGHYHYGEGCKAECPDPTYTVRFVAAPGERNRVVARHEGDTYEIADSGASVTTKAPQCQAVDAHTVSCSVHAELRVRTLDLRDRVTLTGAGTVNAGSGDDRLVGEDGDQTLVGGRGRDLVDGGPGDDLLRDGNWEPGHGTADADTFVGGTGVDTLSYAARLRPVSVDLRQSAQGAPHEHDSAAEIENAVGGQDDDRIVGTDGPNTLEGGPGNGSDRLVGLGGDDLLVPGEGEDRTFAGPGDDQVTSYNSSAIRHVGCGSGTDTVMFGGYPDLVSEPCDYIASGSGEVVRQELPPPSLDLPILYATPGGCTEYCEPITVEVREASLAQMAPGADPGRVLARASFPATPSLPNSRPVRLSDDGKAEVRRLGVVRVLVLLNGFGYMTILRDPGQGSEQPRSLHG
jgi:hypothetical protein